MRFRTLQNVLTKILTTTAQELLPQNARRKAFVIAPVGGGQTLVAQVFDGGFDGNWTVPPGVTTVVDAFCWGSGGNGGVAAAGLGGGGGGAGAFSSTGAQIVVPGTTWAVIVDQAGDGEQSSITNASATVIANSGSGINAANAVGGAAGAATAGNQQHAGGAGPTTAVAAGGGGAGAGGFGGAGSAGTVSAGGAGGGATGYLTYGAGGTGGDGGTGGADGQNGASPGAGGGGMSDGAASQGLGSDGLAVIFYFTPLLVAGQAGCISLSARSDVQPGQGTINWYPNLPYPVTLTDDEIGDIIGEPWFAVSGVDGVIVQVTEYFYQSEDKLVRAFE
jgi:hypothetical protein